MFPASRSHAVLVAALVGILLVGLLPAAALASGPVANDDHATVPVDAGATAIDVLASDTGSPLTIESATTPAHGTVVIAGDSLSVTYEPDASFHGTDTFEYTITDGGATDVGTVTVDVNSPPTAVDDPGPACQTPDTFGGAAPVIEDFVNPVPPPPDYSVWVGSCALLHNDSDPDGDPLTWKIVTQPSHGDLVKIDEESFGYKPDADYSAADHGLPATQFDTFTYRAFDGSAYSAPATMRIWVAPVNDAPTFDQGPAQVIVGEDSGPYSAAWATNVSPGPTSESWQTVHFDVETDLNGVPNLFAAAPAMDADGNLTFTPAPDEVGLVHVTIRARDDGGLEDWSTTGQVPPADTSADVTFDIVVMPDAVTGVDDAAAVDEDEPSPVELDVLGNDSFPPGSTITAVTQGTLGLVEIAPDGRSVMYSPDENENGPDSFTYTLDDGAGSTDTATVNVTIAPTNDAPDAVDDSMTVKTNGPAKAVDVLGNDTDIDGDTLLITETGPAAKGTATITGGGTGVTYQPNPDETGADSFTYTISDGHGGSDVGTVLVSIADNGVPDANDDSPTVAEDDPPTAVDVLGNDSDPDNDPILITDASDPAKGTVVITGGGTGLTYEPDADANGSDSFTYAIDDGISGTAIATVNVNITPTEDGPVANADTLVLNEDALATSIPVLSNDTDADGDAKTITGKTDGLKGAVVITGLGTGLTYKPNANANGSDSFTYTIDDGNGGTATGTVNVTIDPINDKPDARNDTAFTVLQGSGARTLAVLSNDLDIDLDALHITARTNGAHGTVTITGGGTGLTYDPSGLYYGSDVFTYTVNDGHGATDTATVLLNVVKDTLKPAATAPAQALYNQTGGAKSVKVRITWGGTDSGGTGIARYRLQVSVNGGSYSTVTLSSAAASSATRTLSINSTYRFRVRATDRGGNVGAYAYGPTFKAVAYQNSSSVVHYTGSWKTSSSTSASGGSHAYTSTSGASVSYTGSMRNISWLATRTTTSGSAQVWVDGSLVATINLRASSTGYRQLVYHRDFGSLATHTIQIRSLGGGRVYFDAFDVLR